MDLLRGQVALVIAAHTDDEVIGCVGTIAMLAARGAEVQILLLADGVGARHPSGSAASAVPEVRAEVEVRREAARRASAVCDALAAWHGDRIVTCHGGFLESPEDFSPRRFLEVGQQPFAPRLQSAR